ncbi:GAF domain-containing protein [Changchengzhania lutea]|uniref:GAF domain-containing protein n=1 Tax=Changchengzhania lutea TaxID=2049305 RepID=UPI00115DF645|nr:GAF domain-containing protein [Changchengzhania lutea]
MYNLQESPMQISISFNKLMEHYEAMAKGNNQFAAIKAQHILDVQKPYPVLRDGFSDFSLLEKYKEEIGVILQDTFSPVLTNNEIKAASAPFQNIIFNSSERFKNIIKAAGDDFELQIKNMPEDDTYIIACGIILNFCYGYNLNFKRPFYYEIPDANGVTRFYKILYNADFTEIIPTEKAIKITKEDYDELIDDFENIELWKEKFPPNSYIFKGFVISNIFDITDDQSISNIKSNLIGENKHKDQNFINNFQEVFRSLFGIKDLRVGFSIYNQEDDVFEHVYGEGMISFLLNGLENVDCNQALCGWSYDRLLKENKYFSISDVDKSFTRSKGKAPHIKALQEQGIKSAIFAPIANDKGLMGILEIVSQEPKVLNSINAVKLVDVMPFIVSAVERSKNEEKNLIRSIIQQECTSIHPSVSWKFEKAAKQFIIDRDHLGDKKASFKNIVFKDVYPLFGQIDVKGSSEARNLATQKDLALQLSVIEKIIKKISKEDKLPIYDQIRFQIENFNAELADDFKVSSEHLLTGFFKQEIKPLFKFLLEKNTIVKDDITDYFNKIDADLDLIYFYRKHYDDTIALINKNMSGVLDEKQVEVQAMYPHFFERFKTDGVEHNMYIGESITKEHSFNPIYLYNLRLWQLQVMCEMENHFYQNQSDYPISLDVASMILVFNQPLSIRFRMDEKQFDVDGTYNARYEVVKKRVDKALIKGTEERITTKGKISIIYSQKEDEMEYLKYVKFLQSKNMLADDIELLELQDLQGVTGLKAIRIGLIYETNIGEEKSFYTYSDLMKTLKA